MPKSNKADHIQNQLNADSVPLEIKILQQMIRDKSLKVLTRSAKVSTVTMQEVANRDDFVYDYWMAFIMVSGMSLRIMFKIHFNTSTAVSLLPKSSIGRSEDEVRRTAMDSIREQCNVIAGDIKASLTSAQITVGLSIPLVTKGFDEAVFNDKLDEGKSCDVWQLKWGSRSVVCSSVVEVLEWAELENLHFEAEAEPLDDGEFL